MAKVEKDHSSVSLNRRWASKPQKLRSKLPVHTEKWDMIASIRTSLNSVSIQEVSFFFIVISDYDVHSMAYLLPRFFSTVLIQVGSFKLWILFSAWDVRNQSKLHLEILWHLFSCLPFFLASQQITTEFAGHCVRMTQRSTMHYKSTLHTCLFPSAGPGLTTGIIYPHMEQRAFPAMDRLCCTQQTSSTALPMVGWHSCLCNPFRAYLAASPLQNVYKFPVQTKKPDCTTH